jgi:DNA-binding XRE family transcriptional regulator
MPFKKIDAKKLVEEKINQDIEFEKNYNLIKEQYTLIQQVTKIRKEMGLTQKDLADKIGVKQQVISRLENEKHVPTLDNFIKILEGLDLELTIKKRLH